MEFIEVKQFLEHGINEIYTYPNGDRRIVCLAFRDWTSATEVWRAADYLREKNIELSIHCVSDRKFDAAFRSDFFSRSIDLTSILGSSSVWCLKDKVEEAKVEAVFYIYYDKDRIIDGKIDLAEGREIWVEIPLKISRIKMH